MNPVYGCFFVNQIKMTAVSYFRIRLKLLISGKTVLYGGGGLLRMLRLGLPPVLGHPL